MIHGTSMLATAICPLVIQTVGTVVSALAAIGTCVAAYFAKRSADATKATAQGQLFYELLRRYSSNDMHDALRLIGEMAEFRAQDEQKFQEGLSLYRKNLGFHQRKWQPTDIDHARRPVSHFFLTALELYEHGRSLDEDLLKAICRLDGFSLLYHVIEWLELAKKTDYDRERFTRLLDLSGRQDVDKLKRCRPQDDQALTETPTTPKG